jgi:hypothetical protein
MPSANVIATRLEPSLQRRLELGKSISFTEYQRTATLDHAIEYNFCYHITGHAR